MSTSWSEAKSEHFPMGQWQRSPIASMSLCGGKVTYSFLAQGVAGSRPRRITIIISDVKRWRRRQLGGYRLRRRTAHADAVPQLM